LAKLGGKIRGKIRGARLALHKRKMDVSPTFFVTGGEGRGEGGARKASSWRLKVGI